MQSIRCGHVYNVFSLIFLHLCFAPASFCSALCAALFRRDFAASGQYQFSDEDKKVSNFLIAFPVSIYCFAIFQAMNQHFQCLIACSVCGGQFFGPGHFTMPWASRGEVSSMFFFFRCHFILPSFLLPTRNSYFAIIFSLETKEA
jgi:hypothetical protein